MNIAGVEYELLDALMFQKRAQSWLDGSQLVHVVTLNPEMVVEAQHNAAFKQAMERAEVRVADGSGLVWAADFMSSNESILISWLKFLRQTKKQALPGVVLAETLAQLCSQRGEGIFLVGAKERHNQLAQSYLRERFPSLRIGGVGGGRFDVQGPKELLEKITSFAPAVVLVAYGAPKQTEWIEAVREQLQHVRIVVGVGGAFDMWAGVLPRAPRWIQDHHLEWLWRWRLEPARTLRMWRAVITFSVLVRAARVYQQNRN